jgi:hypothetical protein
MSAKFTDYEKAMSDAKTRSLELRGDFFLIQTGAAEFEVIERIALERKFRGMICAVYKDGASVAPLFAVGF